MLSSGKERKRKEKDESIVSQESPGRAMKVIPWQAVTAVTLHEHSSAGVPAEERETTNAMSVQLLFLGCLLLWWAPLCPSETYTFNQNIGVAFEFKVHVDAGKEECFGQYVQPGSTFYVAFQVMRGGDNMAGFAIRNPTGQLVLPYFWKPNAEYEEQAASPGGYYLLCIDNSLSRFASKLVSMYVNSFKRDKWEDYVKELEELDVTVTNFTGTLQTVDGRIGEMLKYQDHSRRQMSKDWYLVDSNHTYVQNWSVAQCLVIFLTSTLQVYFVRKLFDVKNVTPTSKPRA